MPPNTYSHTLHTSLPQVAANQNSISPAQERVCVGCQNVLYILLDGIICVFSHPTHLFGAGRCESKGHLAGARADFGIWT